jgi:hypothetical protein
MRSRFARPRNENGATLVLALIFVTLIGMSTAVLLTFSDASIRATVELRKQATETSTADGAAQVAINTLRKGVYTNAAGQSCFGTADTLLLANFPSSATGSSFVDCSTDEGSGTPSAGSLNSLNTPEYGVLTLGDDTDGEGFLLTGVNSTDTLTIKGGFFSDSLIYVLKGILKSDTSVSAVGSCTGAVVPTPSCSGTVKPEVDPNYPPPTAALTARTVPSCVGSARLITFLPGLYTDANALTACANQTLWFQPGTYYFRFPSTADTWTIANGSIVGGTPTATLTGSDPVMPGSCVSPLTTTTANAGVQFVFGGTSNLDVKGDARIELCGSYSATTPPVAIYGLKTAAGTVPAQSGCIIALPLEGGCPLITWSDHADLSVMYVQGTVYAPQDWIDLTYGRSAALATGLFIKDGIIVSSLTAGLDGVSATGVEIPVLTAGPKGAEVGVLLKVYLCPAASTCNATTGKLRLETKIGLSNPAANRTVKIYSWAVQR